MFKNSSKDGVIVRSAIISTKFLNIGKLNKLKELYEIGKDLTKRYLDIVWNMETKKYAGKDIYDKIKNEHTARFRQQCATKSLDIKRSIKEKIQKRKETLLYLENKYKDNPTEKLEKGIKKFKAYSKKIDKKPEINNFSLDLGGNIVKSITIDDSKKSLYKNWIKLSSLGKKFSMDIPFIKTKPFNKWNKEAKLSNFISINKDGLIKVVFKKEVELKETGISRGCDIGLNKVFSFDANIQSNNRFIHSRYGENENLPFIHKKICRTKPGGNICRKARTRRDQYINYTVNQMFLKHVKTIYLEDIKYIRHRKRTSRYLKCWRYPRIFNKINSKCEENGIKVILVNPRNTSRRCFECGWTSKNNRNGEVFKCFKCNHQTNADINAAKNIKFIGEKKYEINGNSKIGFYFKKPLIYRG